MNRGRGRGISRGRPWRGRGYPTRGRRPWRGRGGKGGRGRGRGFWRGPSHAHSGGTRGREQHFNRRQQGQGQRGANFGSRGALRGGVREKKLNVKYHDSNFGPGDWNQNQEVEKAQLLRNFSRNRCRTYFLNGTCRKDCPNFHVIINKRNIAKWFKSMDELISYDKLIKNYDFNNNELISRKIITATKGQKTVIRGAGVIPIAKVPGAVYILFGYEANNKGRRFSLFTGRRDGRYDKHCIETALRKFCEETYGVFDPEGNDPKVCFERCYKEVLGNQKLIRVQTLVSNCIMFVLPLHFRFMLYTNLLGDAKEEHERRWMNGENRGESSNLIKLDFKWLEWKEIKEKYLTGIKTDILGDVFGIRAPFNKGDLVFLKGVAKELDALDDMIEEIECCEFKGDGEVKKMEATKSQSKEMIQKMPKEEPKTEATSQK